jgi:hypothetical protein
MIGGSPKLLPRVDGHRALSDLLKTTKTGHQ